MADNPLTDGARQAHVRLQRLLDDALDSPGTPDEVRTVLQELDAALEELRINEEELTTQSDQLAASAATIDEERERYVELFEFAPDAYLETDAMGKVLRANRAAALLLGVPARHLTGKLVVSFVDPAERRALRQLVSDAAAGAAPEEVVVQLRTRDERDVVAGVVVAHTTHPMEDSRLRWLIRDITDRVKLETRIEDLADEVDLLTRATDVQRLVDADDPLAETLRGLVDVAAGSLPGCEVGVSLVGRADMERALATGERARELDTRQRECGAGPCIEALRQTEIVRGAPAEWPAIADAVDVVEVVGLPLLHDDAVVGALNIYAFERTLDEHEMRLLDLLARQAAVALQNARLFTAATHLASGLERALETRGVIERAKGVLMAESHIGSDEAFDLLRSASQRENVKLHTIAERIVDRWAGERSR